MPKTQFEASHWYFQGFFSKTKFSFEQNEPKDWERMQVWDGSALKPAMPAGHSGIPNQEQINTLYEYAKNGQLFLFELGSNNVRNLGLTERTLIQLEGQAPVAPGEKATERQKAEYNEFVRGQNLLQQLGDNFANAVNTFNAGRDMKWETEEVTLRNKISKFTEDSRNRNRADRVISEAFAPRPIASGDIFYKDGRSNRDAVFLYDEVFQQQLEANGYDLPQNDKLTNDDAATIHFAIFGARSFMKEQIQNRSQDDGPLASQKAVSDNFNMLVTGMFGWIRVGQPMRFYTAAVMQRGKEDIEAYLADKPDQLGKDLGECVRNIKVAFTNVSQNKFSRDMVAATKLTERLLGLFEKDPVLLQATGLQEQDLEFMRGYVQMGNIIDNYMQSRMKLASADGHGQILSTEERKGILADIVLRRMVERTLVKDNEEIKDTYEYKVKEQEAAKKDKAVEDAFVQWDKENQINELPNAMILQDEWRKKHDAGKNTELLANYPVEHDIIYKLAQPGMLERLRENLMNDPLLMEKAELEDFGIQKINNGEDPLESGDSLDALIDQLTPTMANTMANEEQKQTWFEDLKALITLPIEGQERPWLNPKVASDADRLMIAVPNGEGGKNLVSVASRLAGGLKRLENPDSNTLDLLYKNALEGNLYFYQMGKDMPQRIAIDGARTTVQQLEVPVQPTIWHWIAYIFTIGHAYADILYPEPDRDPAALDAAVARKESRAATIADEVARQNQIASDLANKANAPAKEEQKEAAQEQEKQQEQKENTVTRGLKPYDAHLVAQAMGRMTYTEKSVSPNTLGIDGTKLGMLVTMALASPDLSIRMKEGSLQNNPDETYAKAIGLYMDNMPIPEKGRTAGFLSKARKAVIEGMEAAGQGDYSKLGKLVAQGLIQNNKMLRGFKQLDDRFSTYATISTRVLDMLNDNEQLKQATLDALNGDTKQLEMANAAKNINNLRVEAMPLYEKMLTEFGQTVQKRTWDKVTGEAKMKTDDAIIGNKADLAKVTQLFSIEVAMNTGNFNLQTTEYAQNGVVEKYNEELQKSDRLYSLMTDPNRVEKLKNPMTMKNLFVQAATERNLFEQQSVMEKNVVNAMENKPKERALDISVG